jgi:hypothetical protein
MAPAGCPAAAGAGSWDVRFASDPVQSCSELARLSSRLQVGRCSHVFGLFVRFT